LAKELKIDGILAYASDPAAPTAAYVSEKLNLPGNTYMSVRILTEKDLFRVFLRDNDFNVPLAKGYTNYETLLEDIDRFTFPIMLKPVDSSGSKGVTKVEGIVVLKDAYENALAHSRSNKIIVEEFINKKGAQIGGDGFVVDGKLKFLCLGDQFNNLNCNPFVPTGMTFPSSLCSSSQEEIHEEIQRLLSLLDFRQGAINIEVMLDSNDNIYLMEIGPRNGGNCIPEIIRYTTCFDSIKSSVEIALGNEIISNINDQSNFFYSYYVIHSRRDGKLKNIEISISLSENILEKHVFKAVGDEVNVFNGSNATLGIILLRFSSAEEMKDKISNMSKYVKVDVTCVK
ncbi:ATP-grasp domain-containing protein, partial [Ancylomarina sp.]|uniref:ATP-grasp domain-containing protein n=1 Tax=Ancylomarina sp. TaxID=1970196 RepID=UPI0035640BA9